jgi:Na+/proline symporter
MSDINILSDPLSQAFLALVFGGPGIPVGAIIGALVWRAHRIWGAVVGAVVGFAVCLGGVWVWLVN